MRIVISGSTSTGKTTLLQALSRNGVLRKYRLKLIITDERRILMDMGFKDTSLMQPSELCDFSVQLMKAKIANENGEDDFITEHSYADGAAYWYIREMGAGRDVEETSDFIKQSKDLARHFTLHIMLPFGQIPFEPDGFRSTDIDFHHKISTKIEELLINWRLAYTVLHPTKLLERVQYVDRLLFDIKRGSR